MIESMKSTHHSLRATSSLFSPVLSACNQLQACWIRESISFKCSLFLVITSFFTSVNIDMQQIQCYDGNKLLSMYYTQKIININCKILTIS